MSRPPLVRPDADVRSDVLGLVERYTEAPGCWDAHVSEGVVTVRRTRGAPERSRAVEEFALRRLVATVPGVVAVQVLPRGPATSISPIRKSPGRHGALRHAEESA